MLDYSPTPGPYLPAVSCNDTDDKWEDESLACDGDTDTFAKMQFPAGDELSYLEFLPPQEKGSEIRFWIASPPDTSTYWCRIEIFYEGFWHGLWSRTWPDSFPSLGAWITVDYPDKKEKAVEKARFAFYPRTDGRAGCLSEFQFATMLDVSSSNNESVQNTVSNNGIGIRSYRSSETEYTSIAL
jgi:hypothetical protein